MIGTMCKEKVNILNRERNIKIEKCKMYDRLFNQNTQLYVYFVDSEGTIAIVPIEVPVRYFEEFLQQHKQIYLVTTAADNTTLFELRGEEIFKVSPKYRGEVYEFLEECGIDTASAKSRGV
ncbi:hypothetical protein [Bacillus cereus]|nr:hypothetical protein [Bacillus cereus]